MNILSHGLPFFCAYDTLRAYAGAHTVRSVGVQPEADYRLRPEVDTIEVLMERLAPAFVPDLILVWTPENDPPPLGIERSPVPTVCFAGDWNLFHAAQERGYGRYDVVLCDRPGVTVLRNEFVQPHYWQPLYAHNPLLHRDLGLERDIDVLYVGNLNLGHRTERAPCLRTLATLPPQHRVLITTGAWGEEFTRLHNRARIVFNHAVRGELNLRTFESMACGALAFLEEDNTEVRDFFRDGVDIVLYNADNLADKVAYYLAHPAEAEAIARRGQACVGEFAGAARLDALVAYALALPRSGRPFLQLDSRERALEDFKMITISQRAEYGPLDRRLGAALPVDCPDDARAWNALARSRCYFHDRPNTGLSGRERMQGFRKAVELDPESAVHALSGALAAQVQGRDNLVQAFAKLALRATSAAPGDYLWGAWHHPFWTRWLRDRALGKATLAALHAEAHALLGGVAQRKGDARTAVQHFAEARALDPGHPGFATDEAQALIDVGALAEAAEAAARAVREAPLFSPLLRSVGELARALGDAEAALACDEEAALIDSRVVMAWEAPRVCTGHAAQRVPAREAPTARQETALRRHAAETGDFTGLIWFLASSGRGGELAALITTVPTDDRAARALLRLLDEAPLDVATGLHLLDGLADVSLYHLLLKRCLRNGDVDGAWAVADAVAQVVPHDVSCLNLLARWLSQYAPARGLSVAVERSLAIAPKQEDIAALLESPHAREIHLDLAPKAIPISFYLPAFNVARYIHDTLEAVFAQDYPLLEVIVVDDGSPDDSIEIASAFPVTVLRHPHNLGLAAAATPPWRRRAGPGCSPWTPTRAPSPTSCAVRCWSWKAVTPAWPRLAVCWRRPFKTRPPTAGARA